MREVLEELESFTDKEFEILLAETATPEVFENSQERCETIAKKLDRDPAIFTFMFATLDFLYTEVTRKAKDEITLKLLIDELLKFSGFRKDEKSEVTTLSNRLLRLLSYNENAERRDKISRLKRGFLPNAVGFSSFVDLRPNIGSDRSRINEFVPLVQFRISTDSDDDEQRSLVFQLDERALGKLSEAVQDLQKKLDLLRRDAAVSARIVQ
jgi:hypothetical protein